MSEAPQEADPVSGVRPGGEQATNPVSHVRPGQAVIETVVEDEQSRNPPSGVPPGDEQATNPVSLVRLGLQETRETFPTGDEQAAGEHVAIDIQPEDEQARNPTIYTYALKVKGVVTEVLIGYSFAIGPVTTLGKLFSIPECTQLVISVVIGAFLRVGEIRNVMAGCIQFELRCFNEDGFLEVLRDYESGKLEKRLQKKFSKIGIKTTGLEVKITNSEEVERTKADIEKRRSYSTPAKTESEAQKRRNQGLSVTDERELSTKKEPGQASGESKDITIHPKACECKIESQVVMDSLDRSRSEYEQKPRVFLLVSGNVIVGTAFILKDVNSKSRVISWSSKPQPTCGITIVKRGGSKHVRIIPLRKVGNGNLLTRNVPEEMYNSVHKFEAATPNTTGKEVRLFMVSRRVACGLCDRLLMRRWLEICPLEKLSDDTYVRKRGGEFKSFPVGAPVVDCKDKLVGIVTGITGSEKNKVTVLGIQDVISELDDRRFMSL